jgi:hypothetical protein
MSETLSWVDPDGNEYALTGSGAIELLVGRQGALMPPVAFSEEEVPSYPGARLREARHGVRDVDLPLCITAASELALWEARRAWAYRFDATRGDGKLRSTGPDGSQRDLTCRYSGGLQGNEGLDVSGAYWMEFVATLRAVDPYWYGRNAVLTSFVLGSLSGWFPMFPLRLASSSIFSDASLAVLGDKEAWPIWEVTGPGSALMLRNLTTGKLLSLSSALSAGEKVTIDTRPGRKSVTRGDGTNLFPYLDATSSLWSLRPGSNSLRVELSGATAASAVQLSYYPRYLSV